jgi:hypothetical protein
MIFFPDIHYKNWKFVTEASNRNIDDICTLIERKSRMSQVQGVQG